MIAKIKNRGLRRIALVLVFVPTVLFAMCFAAAEMVKYAVEEAEDVWRAE